MDDNRIVLINGNQSEWYEQVIFILKKPENVIGKNLVAEAEKIINNYMTSQGTSLMHPKLDEYKKVLNAKNAKNQEALKTSTAANKAVASTAKGVSPATRIPQKKGNLDFTGFFVNICLILTSVLLGFIMHRVMQP